jgi:hypothetical protein
MECSSEIKILGIHQSQAVISRLIHLIIKRLEKYPLAFGMVPYQAAHQSCPLGN